MVAFSLPCARSNQITESEALLEGSSSRGIYGWRVSGSVFGDVVEVDREFGVCCLGAFGAQSAIWFWFEIIAEFFGSFLRLFQIKLTKLLSVLVIALYSPMVIPVCTGLVPKRVLANLSDGVGDGKLCFGISFDT
jgi:hypothetical protein